MAIELVSYDDLAALLGLEASAITDYPALGVLQLSVLAGIEEYIGRELENKERTENVFVGNTPTQMIGLVGLPVASISTVTVTTEGTEEEYGSDDYYITEYGIKFHAKVVNAKVVVSYIGGLLTVPTTINRAALIQTAYEFQSKDQIGAESVSTDGGMVSRPPLGLLAETKRMLNSEKHPLNWT